MARGKGVRFAAVLLAITSVAAGAQGRRLTTADYARAESFMDYNVNPLVYHSMERGAWLADGRFWYRDAGPEGVQYVLVDPVNGTKGAAFDQTKLAAALTAASNGAKTFDANHLDIQNFSPADDGRVVSLVVDAAAWRCDLSAVRCERVDGATLRSTAEHLGPDDSRERSLVSPDGTKVAFLRDWNLWVREVATGRERQLTTDGVKDYGYATDNAGWIRSGEPVLLWSPDSKKIATYQQDQRKTGEMYLVPVTNGHPKLEVLKYPLVGDANVTVIERVIVNVDAAKVVRLKMPPDQHRSSLCDDLNCRAGSGWDDVQWSGDSAHVAFVSTSRDHKQEWLRVADAATGDVHDVLPESVATFFESGNGRVNWRYLSGSNEVIWFSERDGWGQLYLYELKTGKLKNQITRGDGNVTEVLHVDDAARRIYFLAVGKEAGVDPYFAQLYSVGFDGQGLRRLTPENEDHAVSMSPDGHYFVDVYSTAVQPQTAVIRDGDGKVVVKLARQDITRLVAAGWVPPTPITVKARDGKTDLYGFLFKPTQFDAAKKYPIVNRVYPGPQAGSCGTRSFVAAHSDMQALAELGFVVVCIDGMGTPGRSKAFHEAYYGNMGDATIPDQVVGMKELAAKFPWIDIERAGIYGHSGGGSATASAMFHYPDFFKVGVSESGNHDNRDYEDDWGEKWSGLLVKNADGTSNYDSQANQNFAKNLKGHLLLVHGTMDDNVPMNNTLLVVDALIKANKDFDLLLIPNAAHAYGEATQYMTRRRWDYFVRYLAGNVPPHEYAMKPYAETLVGRSGPATK